jgi:hypothetical protein
VHNNVKRIIDGENIAHVGGLTAKTFRTVQRQLVKLMVCADSCVPGVAVSGDFPSDWNGEKTNRGVHEAVAEIAA